MFPLRKGKHSHKISQVEAAKKRGEVEVLLSESNTRGTFFITCQEVEIQAGDHRSRHHLLAAQDFWNGHGKGRFQKRLKRIRRQDRSCSAGQGCR